MLNNNKNYCYFRFDIGYNPNQKNERGESFRCYQKQWLKFGLSQYGLCFRGRAQAPKRKASGSNPLTITKIRGFLTPPRFLSKVAKPG